MEPPKDITSREAHYKEFEKTIEEARFRDKTQWESQYARLGYFLLASSFLVASFIQLVTTNGHFNTFLIYAIAALGTAIAELYTYINLLTSKSTQAMHTWVIPFLFLAFWLVTWIVITEHWCYPILWFLAILMGCFCVEVIRLIRRKKRRRSPPKIPK